MLLAVRARKVLGVDSGYLELLKLLYKFLHVFPHSALVLLQLAQQGGGG